MPPEYLIGDLTFERLQLGLSEITGYSYGAEERLIKQAGLEGTSDPLEKLFSVLSSHIEKHGMDDLATSQFSTLKKWLDDPTGEGSKFVTRPPGPYSRELYDAYKRGKELHEASLKSATKSVPEVVDTSKFATETPEEMAERLRIEKTSAETDARIKKTIDETKPAPLTEAEIAERKAKQDELFRKKPVDEAPPSRLRRNINRSQALSSSRSCASRNSKIKIKGWQNWF